MRRATEPEGGIFDAGPNTEVSGQLNLAGVDVGGTLQEHDERLAAVERQQQRADPDVLDTLQVHGQALQAHSQALRAHGQALQALREHMDERFDRLEKLIRGPAE